MIDIVIQKSHNPKKNMMRFLMGLKLLHLGLMVMRIIQFIRMLSGGKTILKGMVMRIGAEVILNQPLGYHVGFYGKKQH